MKTKSKKKLKLPKNDESERYFLDSDQNDNWYLLPLSKKIIWEVMTVNDNDDQKIWNKFETQFKEHRLNSHPNSITFTDPK